MSARHPPVLVAHLGIYGDFLFSEATQHGRSPIASLTGPVFGLIEEAFNLTQGNLLQAAQGKEPHTGAEVIKFARGNVPVVGSLWYAKAALDRLIFHQFQEMVSPGYLRTMERRAQREFGQQWWWEPGEFMPGRPPDIETMGGKR